MGEKKTSNLSFVEEPDGKNILQECSFNRVDEAKNKVKFLPIKDHEFPAGEYIYNCTLSLTSALDGCKWFTPRPGRYIPGEDSTYSLYRGLGGT